MIIIYIGTYIISILQVHGMSLLCSFDGFENRFVSKPKNQTLLFLLQMDKHNYCNLTYISNIYIYIEKVSFQVVNIENKYL